MVVHLTYLRTLTGWVLVFIVDVTSCMVVGRQASRSLRTDVAIGGLNMAVYNRGCIGDVSGVIHRSDRGVQYPAVRYSERLADNSIVASVGSKGHSDATRSCLERASASGHGELQRPLRVGTYLPPRTLGRAVRCRFRDPRVRPLVQPPPPPWRDHRRPRLNTPAAFEADITVASRSQPTRSRPTPPSAHEARCGNARITSRASFYPTALRRDLERMIRPINNQSRARGLRRPPGDSPSRRQAAGDINRTFVKGRWGCDSSVESPSSCRAEAKSRHPCADVDS